MVEGVLEGEIICEMSFRRQFDSIDYVNILIISGE